MKITIDNLINKIKENGYWKVIIRPIDFEEKRITDKDTAAKIAENSSPQYAWKTMLTADQSRICSDFVFTKLSTVRI